MEDLFKPPAKQEPTYLDSNNLRYEILFDRSEHKTYYRDQLTGEHGKGLKKFTVNRFKSNLVSMFFRGVDNDLYDIMEKKKWIISFRFTKSLKQIANTDTYEISVKLVVQCYKGMQITEWKYYNEGQFVAFNTSHDKEVSDDSL